MATAARRNVLKLPIWLTRMMLVYFSSEPALPSFSIRRTGPPMPAQCTSARKLPNASAAAMAWAICSASDTSAFT